MGTRLTAANVVAVWIIASPRYRACVDWVEFTFSTTKPTQARHIWNQLNYAMAHVEGCDENNAPFAKGLENTTTCKFRVRIQEPKNSGELKNVYQCIRDVNADSDAKLTGIEIAFDTYLPGANSQTLAEAATDLYRFSTNTPGQDWNLYRRRREGRTYVNELSGRRELVKLLADGWQLVDARDKEVDTRYHVYVKTTDRGDKPLPTVQHRARFEVTLRGAALPCKSLNELMAFRFERLANHFKFRKLAPGIHPGNRHWYNTYDIRQLGRRGAYPKPSRNVIGRYSKAAPSIFPRVTVADDELSRRGALESLRKLTRRWTRIA